MKERRESAFLGYLLGAVVMAGLVHAWGVLGAMLWLTSAAIGSVLVYEQAPGQR